MTLFRILFAVLLCIVIFALWQCSVIATAPLTVTTPQGSTVIPQDPSRALVPTIYVLIFAALFLGGAAALQARGRTGLATLLLLVPIVPFILSGLLWIGLMILFTMGSR